MGQKFLNNSERIWNRGSCELRGHIETDQIVIWTYLWISEQTNKIDQFSMWEEVCSVHLLDE